VQTSSTGISDAVGITGGDGAYCFIDQTDVKMQISSYVYNQVYMTSNSWSSYIKILDETTGSFINPSDYDDKQNVYYSAKAEGNFYRVTGLPSSPTSTQLTYATGTPGKISHIKVSPYGGTSGTVFIGTETGRIYKITNSLTGSPKSTLIYQNITSTVSCIEIGGSDDTLLVTYSNYGNVNSVIYSTDGGLNWKGKDNTSLPDFPIRWALFNPANRQEVILATELGVWGTQDITATNPVWKAMNNGMPKVRVNMLKVRSSDLQVVAATFGRGYFTSDGFNSFAPRAKFGVNTTNVCLNGTMNLYDSSENKPTGWKWRFSPNQVVFVSGTDSTSQNPVVRFLQTGTYSVTLEASNGNGFGTSTKNNFITVQDTIIPTVQVFAAKNPICPGEQAIYNYSAVNEGTAPARMWYLNGFITGNSGPSYVRNNPSNGEKVYLMLTSNIRCASRAAVTSNTETLTINPTPAAAVIDRKGDSLYSKTSADSFWWYLNGNRIPGNKPSIRASAGGNYTALAWKGGCVSGNSNSAQWWPAAISLLENTGWKLFPSPVQGKYFELETESDLSRVFVSDLNGRTIAVEVQKLSPRKFILQSAGLSAGTYILNGVSNEGTISAKFQVVK
jgi:PKD repeat protein